MDHTLLMFVFFFHMTNCADWGYEDHNGPSNWTSLNYDICGQSRQSPVDIPEESTLEYDPNLQPFILTGFDDPSNYNLLLINTGYTAQININGGLFVEGGNLPNRFVAVQFHFHWGAVNNRGSEHTTNGKSYPLEMHIVSFNEKYDNLSHAASQDGDGLAVLGFYIQSSSTANGNFAPLVNKLSDIRYKDQDVTITDLNIRSMLPAKLDRYYRYAGSLTTPPCYQSVIWSVFDAAISLSNTQITAFRTLTASQQADVTKKFIVDNYRPVQPLNNRDVTKSFTLSSASFAGSNLYLIICLLSYMYMQY